MACIGGTLSYDGSDLGGNASIPEPSTAETGLTKVLGIEQPRERILAALNELPESQCGRALRLRFYGGLAIQ